MNAEILLSPLSAALSRFSQIVFSLGKAIADCAIPPLTLRGGPIPPMKIPLAEIAWARIRRAERLFLALAERFRAGKLRPDKLHIGKLKPLTQRTPSRKPRAPLQATASKLFIPRRFGWLVVEARHNAACNANHLRLLLAEPDMQALLIASPRAAKILAPICHMLGIEKALLTPVGRSGQRFQLAPLGQQESPRRGISEAQSAIATLPQTAPSHRPISTITYSRRALSWIKQLHPTLIPPRPLLL